MQYNIKTTRTSAHINAAQNTVKSMNNQTYYCSYRSQLLVIGRSNVFMIVANIHFSKQSIFVQMMSHQNQKSLPLHQRWRWTAMSCIWKGSEGRKYYCSYDRIFVISEMVWASFRFLASYSVFSDLFGYNVEYHWSITTLLSNECFDATIKEISEKRRFSERRASITFSLIIW